VVGATLFLLVAAAIFALLYFLVYAIGRRLPDSDAKRLFISAAEIFLIVAAVLVLIGVLLALVGYGPGTLFRWGPGRPN
jgi:hypothetical protein